MDTVADKIEAAPAEEKEVNITLQEPVIIIDCWAHNFDKFNILHLQPLIAEP